MKSIQERKKELIQNLSNTFIIEQQEHSPWTQKQSKKQRRSFKSLSLSPTTTTAKVSKMTYGTFGSKQKEKAPLGRRIQGDNMDCSNSLTSLFTKNDEKTEQQQHGINSHHQQPHNMKTSVVIGTSPQHQGSADPFLRKNIDNDDARDSQDHLKCYRSDIDCMYPNMDKNVKSSVATSSKGYKRSGLDDKSMEKCQYVGVECHDDKNNNGQEVEESVSSRIKYIQDQMNEYKKTLSLLREQNNLLQKDYEKAMESTAYMNDESTHLSAKLREIIDKIFDLSDSLKERESDIKPLCHDAVVE
ncbi:hypothetical protein BDA99DRAFT_541471 [Phascolomyces articulosus]|uniref:Uncharacterized protein n=1 Tax=Phascolomyces articulosus TaxID=60185 RepID=A0AAD5K592_9FUNG|nr:hypothetical protein BDA99DRAFT_541471 [Phascolomyces articulosus]